MHDEPHVRSIDAHAERHRRDDDVDALVEELLLVAAANLVGKPRVIRHRAVPLAGEPLGERLDLLARRAIDDPRLAAVAFQGFPFSQVPVAGKTGTAEVSPHQPYSWFAAMAPANDPKYVIACLVEQGGHGSTTAAPVVRSILEGLFHLPKTPFSLGSIQD